MSATPVPVSDPDRYCRRLCDLTRFRLERVDLLFDRANDNKSPAPPATLPLAALASGRGLSLRTFSSATCSPSRRGIPCISGILQPLDHRVDTIAIDLELIRCVVDHLLELIYLADIATRGPVFQ